MWSCCFAQTSNILSLWNCDDSVLWVSLLWAQIPLSRNLSDWKTMLYLVNISRKIWLVTIPSAWKRLNKIKVMLPLQHLWKATSWPENIKSAAYTAKLWLSQVNYIYTSEYMWHKNFRATFSKKISPPKT